MHGSGTGELNYKPLIFKKMHKSTKKMNAVHQCSSHVGRCFVKSILYLLK